MTRSASAKTILTERLTRTQRVGLFGQRGVGKTTFLTMLYREAVGGRFPGLRLAAADARTANYLSDKILQLETGQALPATLAETELRFHLYYQGGRVEIVVKDYQGEHVALGREEPIREFLRDCDAVWLCLDASLAAAPHARLQAQQEAEQMIEDYLAAERQEPQHRPTAFVLTKADLLEPAEKYIGPAADAAALGEFVRERFNITRHALASHCPDHGLFAVSSLGGPITPSPLPGTPGRGEQGLNPLGLDGPLAWLAGALRAQDEARLERLWELAPRDKALLERGVTAFARRYPDAPATAAQRERLADLRRRTLRRRVWAWAGAAACLVFALWAYDALGAQAVQRFEAEHANDLAAVKSRWESHQLWHPTRHLLRPAAARAEEEHLRGLDADLRRQQLDERLAGLRRQAADEDAGAEAVWQQFQSFHADFPECDIEGDLRRLRDSVKARRDVERERKAEAAFAELRRPDRATDLTATVASADRFLRDYGDTGQADAARKLRAAVLRRIDERDFEAARAYSAKEPLNFFTRRKHYQDYLSNHPDGAFVKDAAQAILGVEAEWDKHDFRAVADHYHNRVGEVKELETRCRSYLALHPRGRFRASAEELLRWTEQVSQPHEYRVSLLRGAFASNTAAWASRGPYLSVEIEVNGVRHGPSNIVAKSYGPEWYYEFPRRVKWKLGDSVKIRVKDNYYWDRPIGEVASDPDDPVALRMLCGEVDVPKGKLQFECDFKMPVLPAVE
jgi:hypothetical protein